MFHHEQKMMIKSLSFKQKIGALVGVSVAGMCVFTALSFVQLRDRIIQGRKSQLVTAVDSARAIAAAYQARAAKGELPEADAQRLAKDALRTMRYGSDRKDYIYIWNTQGDGVMHPFKPEWDGQHMIGKVLDGKGQDIISAIVNSAAASKDGTGYAMTDFPRPGTTVAVPKLQFVERVDGWNWLVGSGVYMDDVDAAVNQALLQNLAFGAVALLVIGGLGFVVGRSVLRQVGGDPMVAMEAMQQVARGNLAVNVHTPVRGSLLDGLGTMIGSLRQTVSQVRLSTEAIASASGQIAAGNHDLSSRTEETASNLQETAASMEQLTGTVSQTSESARKANELASSANQAAMKGGQVVEQVVSTMGEITQSSRRIGDIIGVIDGIAFQTNILALNAAVEAARAGEQGRGFAVVANEVRTLAQRSAQAAKEIKHLIAESVERVESGAVLVAETGTSMREIVASVDRVSAIIGEITSAAEEQSSGISQVNVAVSHLDQMTQQNAALVEESAAAAESMKAQAARLAETVSVFDVGQDGAAA